MNWDDLNEPCLLDLSFLGLEIEQELLEERLIPIEFTFQETQKLVKVESSIHRYYAIGQWLSWGPFQLALYILSMFLFITIAY